jgi:hypothetical protein
VSGAGCNVQTIPRQARPPPSCFVPVGLVFQLSILPVRPSLWVLFGPQARWQACVMPLRRCAKGGCLFAQACCLTCSAIPFMPPGRYVSRRYVDREFAEPPVIENYSTHPVRCCRLSAGLGVAVAAMASYVVLPHRACMPAVLTVASGPPRSCSSWHVLLRAANSKTIRLHSQRPLAQPASRRPWQHLRLQLPRSVRQSRLPFLVSTCSAWQTPVQQHRRLQPWQHPHPLQLRPGILLLMVLPRLTLSQQRHPQ